MILNIKNIITLGLKMKQGERLKKLVRTYENLFFIIYLQKQNTLFYGQTRAEAGTALSK
ncbi:hypothetical protein PR048_010059 [Dryococelus australis]|uniref:Uncharacterized protein n=1 Tax=Dryococelus australis TaxID=614101 RepID=A0ABQ9I1N0_9NEOP|nr:hypothetical protein PR048_010059 [Dryococelus australis]